MNIKEDILNILKLIFGILFFALLNSYVEYYLKHGELNYSLLKNMLFTIRDFFIPYQLPLIIFFYFFYKYNIKGNK